MKSSVVVITILALVLSSSRPSVGCAQERSFVQGRPGPDGERSQSELAALRAQANAEVIGGVTALLIAIFGLGGGALASGIASQRHGIVCDSNGALFHFGPCVMHDTVVGYDTGLLAASLSMAAAGILTLIIGATFIHSGRRRLRDVGSRTEVSFGGSPDGAVATFAITF